MHKNWRHIRRKEERARYSPTQPTLRVVWQKVFRTSRSGVEHFTYVPTLVKAQP